MAVSKKAWIRVVEAFLSAMLVIVVIVLVVNQQQSSQANENTPQIYGAENLAIRAVELNNTLRGEVIGIPAADLPLNSENSTFPAELNNTINNEIPSSLACESQVCNATGVCDYWKSSNSAVYVQDVLITATPTDYSPRKLKLFCWEK